MGNFPKLAKDSLQEKLVVDDDTLGQGLLRAHVPDRAQQVTADGDPGVDPDARQAEVGDPRLPPKVEDHVRRLHIAADDAVLVGVVQGFGQ